MNRGVRGAMRGYAREAVSAFRLAPLEVALGVVTAVVLSITMRENAEEVWARFAISAALALPVLFGLSVLRARGVVGQGVRWGAAAAALLAIAAYGGWMFDPERESEGWRFAGLLGAAVMAVSLVPAVGVTDRARKRTSLWCFNARLLTRIVTVVAYGIALFAALAGAVAAVSALFDLRTPEQLYSDLAGMVFFALVPWVVVGGIPELIAAPEGESQAPRSVRLLGRYLYAPVLAIYLVILLAYAVKVLATGEAPKNLLSPIILVAGAFGFLGSVLLEPLRRDPEHTGVARLMRFLPVPMLALLPFALWAVWVRRDQYGWTEFRYLRFALLVALGVLAVVGAVQLVRRREPILLLVPLVLGATLLLASFGPWGSVAVSRRSQQARLRDGLAQAGVLSGDLVTRPLSRPNQSPGDTLPVPAETYERISGSLIYLYDEHGADAVQPLFASDVSGFENGQTLLSALRFRAGCRPDQRMRAVSAMLPQNAPIRALPAGTLYRLQGTRRDAPADTGAVRMSFTDAEALVTVRDAAGEWTARADLRPIVARMTQALAEGCSMEGKSPGVQLSADEARRPLLDAAGRVRGELVLTEAVTGPSDDNPVDGVAAPLRLVRLEALVVIAGP